MAAGAKLQKSFQDYFRIPVLLKAIGNTSQQTINHIATIFNQMDQFPINQNYLSLDSSQYSISKQKIKKNIALYDRLILDLKNRGYEQSYKLLFVSDQFDNDWSQFQIIYRISFVILVYQGQDNGQNMKDSSQMRKSDTSNSDLNQKINKINIRLKEKDKKLLGIIFLNDTQQFSKSLIPGLKFTIVPPTLPLQQLSMFIQPWLIDLIPIIQHNIIQHILDCKYQENTIIVFNRSEDKSQPKIMKKKKKFRCLKICGDLALMLHLYQFAYQSYNQADQQLRKVDDWMWVLGCIQGKIACMTSNADLKVKEQNIQKEIQQLINESFIYSKKIKYQSFEVQNLFKILKLLLHEDKQRFDEMIESTLSTSKGLTEQQKFLYYSYIGSLYAKASMQRKRNYYYYKASLIIQNFKPEISQLLLKTIKKSKYIEQWQELNSKIIQKIIQNQKYFSPNGQMHLQLIQRCSNVLTNKQIDGIKDYLNYGHFEQKQIQSSGLKLIEIKQFGIVQSLIKPKPNRLISDQSPKKVSTSGIFVGWKKKLTYLYQDQQAIIFKGTIVNRLPFEIRIKVQIEIQNNDKKIEQFSLILPALHPYKFTKQISFEYSDQLIVIKNIKLSIWNFILYKTIQPQICFELYQKQPKFRLQIQNSVRVCDQKQKIKIQIEQSSQFSLRCRLNKTNSIQCDRLRLTCSVYYDVDVGFQQNQYIFSIQNNFWNILLQDSINIQNSQNNIINTKSNIKFIQSIQKQSWIQYNQNQQILLLYLKKFKTTRNHIKKLQINLDYIKSNIAKYQLNQQYIVQPKIINSVWAQIIQISTPGLQSAVNNMKNLSPNQIQQFCQNWNVIQDYFLAKVKFSKDKFNLRPFKVWHQSTSNNQTYVIGQNQVILSNLTQGEMWLKINKTKLSLKQKQTILLDSQLVQNQNFVNQFIQPLTFRWQNIVNKNMQGSISLKIKPQALMFCPKLNISTKVKHIQNGLQKQNISLNCKNYTLTYTIASEQGQQIKPHKVSIKAYSQIQGFSQSNPIIQSNQNEVLTNQGSNSSNINILVKGKTKINRIVNKNNQHTIKQIIEHQDKQKLSLKKQFTNMLKLKIIKQKLHDLIQKQKDTQISIVVTIQFDQKQIGKWEQVVKLK